MKTRTYLLACAAAAFVSPFALAQPDVAIVAASAANQLTDTQAKLMGTGDFASVDIINVTTPAPLPTLAQLQQYDAIITWSNSTYTTPIILGDLLADYVDAGGGVVVAVFATSTTTANRSLDGRFRTGGYDIIVTRSGNFTGAASLGTILVPGHPTMQGVNTFDGGTTAFRPTTTALAPHGIKIAEWTGGKTLVAASSQFPNRIDLGMWPTSNTVAVNGWVAATDGARLMANALLATIPSTPPCDPDLNADGNTDQDDVSCLIDVVAGNPGCTAQDPDFNGDGNVDQDDVGALITAVAGGGCP